MLFCLSSCKYVIRKLQLVLANSISLDFSPYLDKFYFGPCELKYKHWFVLKKMGLVTLET